MPGINIHVRTSLQRTGKEYKAIHEWIDDPEKKVERHDITRVLEFGKMFEEKYGEEAAREYLQHLHDDLRARFGHLTEDVGKLVTDTLSYFGVKKIQQ